MNFPEFIQKPIAKKIFVGCLLSLIMFKGYSSCNEKLDIEERSNKDVAESHAYWEQRHAEERKAADTVMYTISAVKLNAIYQENEIDADRLFKAKRIEVEGKITRISKDFAGISHIYLSSGVFLQDIDCTVPEEHAAGLKRGQHAIIEAHCTGMTMNMVQLDNRP